MSYMTTQKAQSLISELIDEVWEAETPETTATYPKVFNVGTFKRGEFVNYRVSGVGMPTERQLLEDIDYDEPDFVDKQTIVPLNWGRGFRVAKETIEDLADSGAGDGVIAGKIGTYADMTRRWKRSCTYRVENECAARLLNGTSTATKYVGRDSLALFSASHATVKNPTVTQSNYGGALSLTENNLATAVTSLETQLDDAGFPIDTSGGYILVTSPYYARRARVILGTTKQLDSNNNNISSIADDNITPVVWKYLGASSTAWFLISKNDNPLYWMWRLKPSYDQNVDFDAVASKYMVRMRGNSFHKDWRGIIGFL
jgi:hypothetical protein